MRNMTVLAECARLGAAVLIIGTVGCEPSFDVEAFKTVVRDVYGEPEGAPTIFMDAEGLAKPDWDSLRTILERDLDAAVRRHENL